jgi:hypothetical protein
MPCPWGMAVENNSSLMNVRVIRAVYRRKEIPIKRRKIVIIALP